MERSAAGWGFDPERFARDVAASGARALILVNPHNPTGRCVHRQELESMAAVAAAHDLLVISDEVHADLTYPRHEHIPFASTSAGGGRAHGHAHLRHQGVQPGGHQVRGSARGVTCRPPGVRGAAAAELFGVANVPGVTATLAAWRDGGPMVVGRARPAGGEPPDDRQDAPAARVSAMSPQTRPIWPGWTAVDLGLRGDPAAFFLDRANVRLSPGSDFVEFRGVTSAGPRPEAPVVTARRERTSARRLAGAASCGSTSPPRARSSPRSATG